MKPCPKIRGLEIAGRIGEGGQGQVFRAVVQGKTLALKLYTEKNSTTEQRQVIEAVIAAGAPAGHLAHRFAWPQKLVATDDGKRLGYLMPLIDTGKYIALARIESGKLRHPGFGIMAEAGRQLAECFREMHIAGFCYRDISKNNVLIDPQSGDIVIFDNDNIVVDGQKTGTIQGTTEYMAPEITLGTVRASTLSDQHSLAVLEFILLCGGHPLHGSAESRIKVFDGVAARHLYGEHPVFVFDSDDRSNALPDEEGYRHVDKRWQVLPGHVKALFLKAFTSGLHQPEARVTDMAWQNALTHMLGQRHLCTCGAENFWDRDGEHRQACWHCGQTVRFPPRVFIQGRETTILLARPGRTITSMHLGERGSETLIAEMEQHPSNAALVLLRNKTGMTWGAWLGSDRADVPSGRAIALHPGIRIEAGEHEFIVHA